MINVETFFFPKFCGAESYLEIKKLLNETKINTNHVQQNPDTPVAIKA